MQTLLGEICDINRPTVLLLSPLSIIPLQFTHNQPQTIYITLLILSKLLDYDRDLLLKKQDYA